MGCAASGVSRTIMLFNKSAHNSQDARAILERKLYIAKESPEPDFDLSGCSLRQLPSGIFSICKVFRKDYLYLQNNRLKSLHEGGQLSDLYLIKTLNISYNCFTHLPKNIRFLSSLTELHLNNNLFEQIPDEIKFLVALKVLDLSANKLKVLNPSLGNLKSLRKLNITENKDLKEICVELCHASNLISIELDYNQYVMPPATVAIKGTEEIMKFLCKEANVDYIPPLPPETEVSTVGGPNKILDPFTKQKITWEEQEEAMKNSEKKIQIANQQQREKVLSNLLKDQISLDIEIARVQEYREIEKQKLIQTIQKEEKDIECLINNFVAYDRCKPEVIQQQHAHEQLEHDRLLEITRQNYDNIKKCDILKAMENLLEDNYSMIKHKMFYKDNLNNVKQSLLNQETEIDGKLAELLSAKDHSREALVQQLLEDQDVQKAMVSSLLDQVDARSWSLNQEISFISSHLAKLSVIEQEKKKMHVMYNYNELLNQRIQLVHLLDDLFDQRNKRRKQLLETLNEAENESDYKADFWLRSYQKLLDTAPRSLLSAGKTLDPVLANYLLQEGVIHCLPFLVRFIFSNKSLLNINQEDLLKCGVSLTTDRENILKAIQLYSDFKNENCNMPQTVAGASAPPADEDTHLGVLDSDESLNDDGECVICMENKSQVVFVPCGHMCCCEICSHKDISTCPMCRTHIERIIKVVVS
ncbi:E3 ubiquitin-protein ligase LRSAM1-like [Zerene cesonia]|uniref:E3 ubiquitin-protein ligase LRSAM1-like n=1 Tax=Zerene cesonia TaxID=33412 RepID=UPI0018E4FCF0|nr:E3 ubiquitin-protein ligase LRSAM1-like [Zerene cesonia]